MTGMNASGRVHGYEVEAYVCPEKNIDMTKKAIGMHWAHGRKYLYVQTTCKGRSIVSQILNMWEPASQAHYAIFEPLSGATVERLPSTVPSLINDLFFVLSHMPHARKRLGSVCFVDSLGITRSGLRVIHNPNYRNWCMFSPQYWKKLRGFERRNWYERIEFLTLGSLFSAFAKAQSLRFTTMEVYLSDDRISRKRLTKFLSDNMIDAAKMPKH